MVMAVPALQSVGAAQSLPLEPLQRPQNAYIPNRDIERALPEMDSFEIRNRGRGTRSEGDSAETSPDSSPTLTPSSSRDNENSREGSRLTLFAEETWHRLAQFAQNPFSRPTAEEVEEYKRRHDYHRLKYEKVDSFPEGLPQLAALCNSDDVFANFRKFGRLSSRILLHYQNDLTALEKELDDLDIDDSTNQTMIYRLSGHEGYHGWDDKQHKLIQTADAKYKEYVDLLLKNHQLRALDQCSERNHKQLLDWIISNKPLGGGKYEYIFKADDFVSLAKSSGNDHWFEDRIQCWLDNDGIVRRIVKGFLRTHREARKTDDEYADYYNPIRLSILGNTLVVLLTVGGIAVPVLLLFLQHMGRALMAMVALIFVLFFCVSVSMMTGARVQDVMFGTAAQVFGYCSDVLRKSFSEFWRKLFVLSGVGA